MKVFTYSVAAVFALCISINAASAAIVGGFSDLGQHNGFTVYSFDITSDEDVSGLDFSSATGGGFSGSFNNQGLDNDFDGTPETPRSFLAVTPQPGALTETYFAFSSVGLLSVGVEDGALASDFLGGAFTLDGGGVLVPADTLTTVAVFSSVDGSAPTFLGGFGATASGDVAITLVPEPTSLVLAGLSLIGFIGIRRRS